MRYTNEEIESIAETLNRKYKIKSQHNSDDKSLNIEDLVYMLGGNIEKVAFVDVGANTMSINSATQGDDGRWKDVSFVIKVSAADSPRRQNFTLAHEVGHLFLHYLKANPANRKKSFNRISYLEGGNIEREANIFAGALLMPSKEYKEVYDNCEGDLIEVANVFDVSVPAAEVRASVLGIL